MADRSETSAYHKMVGAYFLGWGFAALDRLLIAMLFPFILPALGLNLSKAGLLMACMALGYMIMSFASGYISDRFGRKKVILPSVVIFSLGSALTGFANSFSALVGIRTVVGAAEGSFNIPATAQIAEEAPVEKRGRYLGFYVSAFALFASFVAPIYATQIAALWGWKVACYLTILPGAALSVYIAKSIKESKRFSANTGSNPGVPKSGSSYGSLFKNRNVMLSCVIAIFWMVWLWSWLSFGTMFFVEVKKFSPALGGVLMAALGAGGFLGMLILPGLSDTMGRRMPIIAAAVVGLIGTYVIIYTHSIVGTWIALFVTAFTCWGIAPILLSIIPCEAAPSEMVASAAGMTTGFGELAGIVLAPPLLGMCGDKFGLATTMLVGASTLLPVIILSFFLKETAPKLAPNRVKNPMYE